MIYYTDGACKPNPGKGGWGFCVIKDDIKIFENFGGNKFTTNNRMEIQAIIESLKHAIANNLNKIDIYTDSKFCINLCSSWIKMWIIKNKVEQMKNPDLTKQLIPLLNQVKVNFKWIKGHDGNKWNEYADYLSNKY